MARQKDGPFEDHNENGQLEERGTHVADERDGPAEFYHENGQLEMKGIFNMGRMCGVWTLGGGGTRPFPSC